MTNKNLMLGAGAVALLGLAWMMSAGGGDDETLSGSVGGGGMPTVSKKDDGAVYNVAFPDVVLPAMPTFTMTPWPTAGGGGDTSAAAPAPVTKKGSIPANIPGDTSPSRSMTIVDTGVSIAERNTSAFATESKATYTAVARSGALDAPATFSPIGGTPAPATKKETISGSSWFDGAMSALGGLFG